MESNTKLHFMYRDASNHKVFKNIVVAGRITEDQYKEIGQTLDDGVFFIANQVGLVGGVDLMRQEGFEVGEDDHCYTTFLDFEDSTFEEIVFTNDPPTEDGLTISQLVARFVGTKGFWDLGREIERTGVLTFG